MSNRGWRWASELSASVPRSSSIIRRRGPKARTSPPSCFASPESLSDDLAGPDPNLGNDRKMVAWHLGSPRVRDDRARQHLDVTAHENPVDAPRAERGTGALEAVKGAERVAVAGGDPGVGEPARCCEYRVNRIVAGADVEVADENHRESFARRTQTVEYEPRRPFPRNLHLVIEMGVHEQQLPASDPVPELH